MLQILSTSNETSTGAELVQNGNFSEIGSDLILNGDFAEIGSDLVTNGDFSAAGINLVSNPNFTDTGAEEITDGDFPSGTTAWTFGSGWSLGTDEAICTADGGYDALTQGSVLNIGSSYKVTYTADVSLITSGSLKLNAFSNSVTDRTVLDGTNTVYLTASGNTFLFNMGGAVGTATITNVSVKELGADWTPLASDPDSVSFGENGLTIVQSSDLETDSRVYQSSVTSADKSYKVTYTIHSAQYTSANELKYYDGNSYVDLPEQGAGTWTFYYTREGTDDTWYFNLSTPTPSATDFVTISSISVQELGEGWTLGTGWSIGEDKAVSDGTAGNYPLQQTIFSGSELGNFFKVQYEITSYTSGALLLRATGFHGAITIDNSVGVHTLYLEATSTSTDLVFITESSGFTGSITNITVQEVGQDWTFGTGWNMGDDEAVAVSGTASKLQQTSSLSGKSCKVIFTLSNYGGAGVLIVDFGSTSSSSINTEDTHTVYGTYDQNNFQLYKSSTFSGDVTDVIVQELDPNGYWTFGTGWSIGDTKAISTVTGSNSDITQSILTAGKTYRTVYEIVDYTAGTAQAVVTGSDGADAEAIETYTEDLTTTGTDFSIRSKLGTFNGSVSSVSVKQLGTYDDQSIYVTAADVQTIAQASVYYLVELTSMASRNSLYFLPSSVVPNNGRYTKLNFTVISKDALPQPTVGIISFYDSVGGFDTYPMGFYEFRIYEQTSSTNLDPLLATGLLEKGFAFVRDFSGNMQELTDGFKEYNPTLTQYVYSK